MCRKALRFGLWRFVIRQPEEASLGGGGCLSGQEIQETPQEHRERFLVGQHDAIVVVGKAGVQLHEIADVVRNQSSTFSHSVL